MGFNTKAMVEPSGGPCGRRRGRVEGGAECHRLSPERGLHATPQRRWSETKRWGTTTMFVSEMKSAFFFVEDDDSGEMVISDFWGFRLCPPVPHC